MLRQRVYRLALGCWDLSDHSKLRQDVALRTAVGVDRKVASAPTLCRLKKWAGRATAKRLHEVLVDQLIASLKSAPEELVLTLTPLTTRRMASRRGAFSMATTTAIATCRCTSSVGSNCRAPTCVPAASMAPGTLARFSSCWSHACV